MSRPLLYVIIPCFNAASTIETTLRSLHQDLSDYFNLKITVVDDGSTDCSREVVSDMQSCMSCIELIEKKNQGVSSARNTGYQYVASRICGGGYIWFFDADDLLFPGCGKVISEILTSKKPDILRFNSVTVDSSNSNCIDKFNNAYSSHILYHGKLKDFLKNGIIPFACWSTIYNCSDICLMKFDEALSIGEDVKWNFEMARAYADSQLVYTDLNVIKYMLRKSSAVNTYKTSTNRRHLDSYIRLYSWMTNSQIDNIQHLHKSYNHFANVTLDKIITRLLSCRLPNEENQKYANLINKWIKQGAYDSKVTAVFKMLSSTPFTLRLAQTCYVRLFLPYIKPFLSRN